MAIYEVKGFHHRKAWIKGDLEAEDVIVDAKSFSTRKAANEFVKQKESEFKRRGYNIKSTYAARGKKDTELVARTGYTWIHENTGDKHEEYYWYRVRQQ